MAPTSQKGTAMQRNDFLHAAACARAREAVVEDRTAVKFIAIAREAQKGIKAYDEGDRTQARISLEAILLGTGIVASLAIHR